MVEHSYLLEDLHLDNSWLTIGTFDGVHLGHQSILRSVCAGAQAAKVPAVVLTFYPHPAIIFGKRQIASSLTTREERVAFLGQLGIDLVVTYPFNLSTAETSAQEFITAAKKRLGFSWLGVGEDFALGKDRRGDVNFLRMCAETYAYELHVFSKVMIEGELISSSRIRSYLVMGDVRKAASMLGRPYNLSGIVIRGDGRGHVIGVPTANLSVNDEKLVPASGVYACRARVGEEYYAAAVNVGVRPTFETNQGKHSIEAHLINFVGDLYGQNIDLLFLERLRGEQRFPVASELLSQIQRDIQLTRGIVNLE